MTKLLYGSYGHHPSGKQYVYYGDDEHRVGQQVVAPVTNKWTNKTYNTMFTIQRTSKVDSKSSQNEIIKINSSLKENETKQINTNKSIQTKKSLKSSQNENYSEQ